MKGRDRKIIDGKLVCSICKENKELSQFRTNKKFKAIPFDSACRICKGNKERHRKSNRSQEELDRISEIKKTPEYKQKIRAYRMKCLYGISFDDYEAMFNNQNGECKICKRKSEKLLYIDHDHKTGAIRGLLCQNCNTALGLFEDNRGFLLNAVEYLNQDQTLKRE